MKSIRSRSIFLGLALTGVIVLTVFAYFTYRPLVSGGIASDNVEEFYHYNKNLTVCNIFVFFILLLTANFIYLRHQYWDTFIWTGLIFAAFAIVDWWWLGEQLYHYKKENNMPPDEYSLGPLIGVLIAIVGAAITFGNYMGLKSLVKGYHKKHSENNEVDSPGKEV